MGRFLRVHPACLGGERNFDFIDQEHVFDVSTYGDMTDLLAASDALISDYSSSPFDYMLTGRPCWLYYQDLEEYRKTTKLALNLDDVKFDGCRNLTELTEAICNFDPEQYRQGLEYMTQTFGLYENGTACAYVAERFLARLHHS